VSTATCFGYINNHHQSVQKKEKSFDIYLQNVVSDLKTYNEFICKISIENVVQIKYTVWTLKMHINVRQYSVAVCDMG